MKKYTLIMMGVVALAMMALAIADQPRKSKGQRPLAAASIPREQDAGQAVPGLPILEDKPLPVLAVEPLKKVKGQILALHQKLADRLSRITVVPPDRFQHYQWLNNRDFQLLGWHGFVQQVDPIPGGYMVMLRISPRVRSKFGASTTVFDHMYEKYAVVGDQVQFMEAIHPPGSGQPSFVTD